MKTPNRKILLFICTLFIAISNNVISQNFISSPFITLSGDNYDFDILSPDLTIEVGETYISWINQNDSIFTVYLKKISPVLSDNIIVSMDSTIKSNPQIAINRYSQGIKIAWQNYVNNKWQILYKNFHNDTLSSKAILIDSLDNDPQITMSIHRICWVDKGKIVLKEFYPELSEIIIVDSINCSSPVLIHDDHFSFSDLLYEKLVLDQKHIFLCSFNEYVSSNWQISQLSKDGQNINPSFGLLWDISYQHKKDTIWRIVYPRIYTEEMDTTCNVNSNYENPIFYSYPQVTKMQKEYTPFFLAFDSDSLDNNREIFIKVLKFGIKDTIINISDSVGYDYKPKIAYINSQDTSYLAIFWIKDLNNKKDIWISKTLYHPDIGSIWNGEEIPTSFQLKQNYPNPFNATTIISWQLAVGNDVELSVYNLLGQKVTTLVSEWLPAGYHEVEFNGQNLSSGLYLYKIEVADPARRTGTWSDVKKMLIIK